MEKGDKELEKLNQEIFNEIKKQESKTLQSKLISVYKISDERRKISEEQYMKEYDALELKYNKQYQEIYKKINKIVFNEVEGEVTPEEKEKYKITDDAAQSQKIEGYWTKVVINSQYFTINEKDKEILKNLVNVTIELCEENKADFIVTFEFAPNDYFTDEKITKKYIFKEGKGDLASVECSDIHWTSEEKNPTIEKKVKKIKKGKTTRNKTEVIDVDSFFSFFKKSDDLLYLDDEVTFFQEDLFANQVEYYLDLINHSHFGKDDVDFSEESGEDDDDDDDDDEDDDIGKKKKKKKKSKKDPKKEECKNQ